jgi:hypothetical protein
MRASPGLALGNCDQILRWFCALQGSETTERNNMNTDRRTPKAGRPRKRRLNMGWKTINGRRYYYKSERVGDRVETTYFGAGEAGTLMADFAADERLKRAAHREQLREERAEADADKRSVSNRFDSVQAEADAAMAAAGFHKHKGQWRRNRR